MVFSVSYVGRLSERGSDLSLLRPPHSALRAPARPRMRGFVPTASTAPHTPRHSYRTHSRRPPLRTPAMAAPAFVPAGAAEFFRPCEAADLDRCGRGKGLGLRVQTPKP